MTTQLAAAVYRTVLSSASTLATLIHINLFSASFNPVILSYFTVQSNILVAVYFIFLTVRSWKEIAAKEADHPAGLAPRFKGAVTMAIMLTGIIYMTLLAPGHYTADRAGFFNLSNFFVHGITPLMVVLDWFFFSKKGVFKRKDIFLWTIIPLAYFVFAIIRARLGGPLTASGSHYPYPFIAIDTYGIFRVMVNVIVISGVYIGVGRLYYMLDQKLTS